MKVTKRFVLGGMAAMPVAASCATTATARAPDTVVVGAGVFGAWTAEMLRRTGRKVELVDAWGPGHARASSGGESRLTRAGYGTARRYSEMAAESLEEWKRLSRDQDLPLFHNAGVLAFYDQESEYATGSHETMLALNLRSERLETGELRHRWPQIDWSGVAFGLLEPDFGALMARRSVATLVEQFIRNGGTYRKAAILPPVGADRLAALQTAAGETLQADEFVFACGPWLGKLFPDVIGERLFVTKQEIFFFRPPAGDARFAMPALPGWIDFFGDQVMYGFPDLEGRGFKVANDSHGAIVDPDTNDRLVEPVSLAQVREYVGRRFPALKDAPLSETRVCQYENSSNGDLLIDRHPQWANTLLVGMGSGHGFKHGPGVGKAAARLLEKPSVAAEPMFTLATKEKTQARSVH
jgi:glycine/D-amino acid oxidase-like deaminating enzyme